MNTDDHPVSRVRWIPVGNVRPNGYNPNVQTSRDLNLLRTSIEADGYTQPIVVRPPKNGIHAIVDGEHRWRVARMLEHDLVPVVVLDRDDAGCLASTVRHNRARGHHGIEDTVELVKGLRNAGLATRDICREIGVTKEELERLEASEETFLFAMGGTDGLT